MATPQLLSFCSRRAAVSGGTASWVLTALLALYTYGRRATSADLAVDRALRPHTETLQPLLQATVEHASPVRALVVCAALSAVALLTRGRRAALLCMVGPALALALAKTLQELLRRPSATLSGSPEAYPSGHMTATAAVLSVCLLLTLGSRPVRRARQVVLLLALALPAVGVGIALTALRDHYVTDVVGGATLAFGAVLLTAVLLDATHRDEVSGRVLPAQTR